MKISLCFKRILLCASLFWLKQYDATAQMLITAPVANNTAILAGSSVSFTMSVPASYPGSGNFTYNWSVLPAAGVSFTVASESRPDYFSNTTATFSSPGVYSITCTVKRTGTSDRTSTNYKTVTVNAPPSATVIINPETNVTPAAAGGNVNFLLSTDPAYAGSGNFTYTWNASPSAGVNFSVPAENRPDYFSNTTAAFTTPGIYTISCTVQRSGTADFTTASKTVNVFAPPAQPNLWAASSDGNMISSFRVINGASAEGPTSMFNPFPANNSLTAALGKTVPSAQAGDYFYWLTYHLEGQPGVNRGMVTVYGASASGNDITRIGSLDLNGTSNSTLLFVRLGMSMDGTGWLLAGGGAGTPIYLAKFTTNGLNPVPITLEDADGVTLLGNGNNNFLNGDICFSGTGDMYILANDGAGLTEIYTGRPNGNATAFTKTWNLINPSGSSFIGQVNGVAFDDAGSMYISTDDGLYFIDQTTVNSATREVQCALVKNIAGLTDLASSAFPDHTFLPVKLLSFSATLRDGAAILNWSSENEYSFSHYEVERSTDGTNFIKTGSLPARGNNNGSKTEYQFSESVTDINTTVFYYRLKVVDIDGKFTYSSVITLRNDKTGQTAYSVYPNPFTEDLKLQVNGIATKTMLTLNLRNTSGQLVYTKNVIVQTGSGTITLDGMKKITPGIYFAEISTRTKTTVLKIIKE